MKRLALIPILLLTLGLMSCGDDGIGKITAPMLGGAGQWTKAPFTGVFAGPGRSAMVSTGGVRALFAGGPDGGVLRSTNDGASWTPVSAGLPGGSSNLPARVFALAVNGRTLFAGGGDVFKDFGVYRSTDLGANWTEANSGLTNHIVRAIAVSGTTVFAGSAGGGVYRSLDNGATWSAANGGLGSLYVTSFAVSGTTVFVGTGAFQSDDSSEPPQGVGQGVYRSTDNGGTWTAVNSGLSDLDVKRLAANGTTLFAGTAGGGLFRSIDGGANWTMVKADFAEVLAADGATVLVGSATNGLSRSTDNGANWTTVNNGLTATFGIASLPIQSLGLSGATWFAGSQERMWRSMNNGDSWAETGSVVGPRVLQFASVGGNILASTVREFVYRSTDNGATWTLVNGGLGGASWVPALAVSGADVFAGTAGSGVFRSTNDGGSWTGFNTNLSNLFVLSLAARGGNVFAGTGGSGVFRSPDNGANWTATNLGLTDLTITALAVSDTTLFAGTPGGGVFRSIDDGGSWTAVNTGLMPLSVKFLAASSTTVFAGINANLEGGGPLFRSTDDGDNWMEVGPASATVTALAVSGTTLFAGTASGGVYRSTDNGDTWNEFSNGLTSPGLASLFVSGSALFAGADEGGVWKSPAN